MAGMLPGVECARRRRFHQGGWSTESQNLNGNCRTRRSSFCLYATSHDSHLNSSSSLQRNVSNSIIQGEKLEGVVRDAKERLDGKLRNHIKSSEIKSCKPKLKESKQNNCKDHNTTTTTTTTTAAAAKVLGATVNLDDLQKEMFGSMDKNNTKKFSWAKLGWKFSNQEECAVCLERFKLGDTLVKLPCAHRFHSSCLVPWLENNAHCPCCRLGIILCR